MFIKRSSQSPPMSAGSKVKPADGDGAAAEVGEKEKTHEEKRQDYIEKKAAERKRDEEHDKLEQHEFNKFPTIMGWYFDGTFTSDFTLFDEYAEYFNEIEDELDAQKDLIIEETFTEKAYRNFWPPKFIGGKYFRTRGVYLDFKEVKEDPPKTPPNINYEKQRGIIGVEIEGDGELQESGRGIRFYEGTYGPQGSGSARDRWYWNEGKRDFKSKDVDGDYIWCDDERIWREADPTNRTPYDWYFDEQLGRYLIRNRATPDDYEFDQERNIYKKKDSKGPSTNGLRSNDYFYDEKQHKWIPITSPTGNITAYVVGSREIVSGPRGKSGKIADDFYYDGETGKFENKDVNNLQEYFYDTRDRSFKKKGQPYGPGKANHYPLDYEFDQKLGVWNPRPARECRHIEPYDWYFDVNLGKFLRIDGAQRDKYAFDAEDNIFKLKDAHGPSVNGLAPEDYFWSEDERQWKLNITVKDQALLEYHEAGKRRILKGDRGKSGKVIDDYYYDAYDGSFFRKDVRKLDNYWFDSVDGVWKKRGQPYGPGVFQLYPENYYFDYDEGVWMPTTSAKIFLAMRRRGEIKSLSDMTPYDYAFHDADGDFFLRDKFNPKSYAYNKETGVFHKLGQKGPSPNKKGPKDYFFDELTACWLPIEHPRGVEARNYKFGRRNNRVGPRGKSGKIPDDYFFSFEEGHFKLKDPESEATDYEYLTEYGIWRQIKSAPPPGVGSVSSPTDYYFDKEEGMFVLKKKLEYGEIYMNPNTNLWMQRWRRPQDYYWEPRQVKYLRKPASVIEKEKAKAAEKGALTQDSIMRAEAEMQRDKDNRRDYDRPWLQNYIWLAADEIRFEQELEKLTKKDGKEGKKIKKSLDQGSNQSAEPKAQAHGDAKSALKGKKSVAGTDDSMGSTSSKRKTHKP